MTGKHYQILNKYLLDEAVDLVCKLITDYNINLRVSSSRKTKIGDYKPPSYSSKFHQISINGDLHPDYFLLVFLHEFAHLLVWVNHKRKALPHGKEWKTFYGRLIRDFIDRDCFSDDISSVLQNYSHKPKATIAGSPELWKALKKDIPGNSDTFSVSELPEGTVFKSSGGRLFKKHARVRTRFRCMCVKTGKWYLFHPLADVEPYAETRAAV